MPQGVTEPAHGTQRPPKAEKSIGLVEIGVSLPSSLCFSSDRYMAPGRDSKCVTLKSLLPTGRSEVKSASTEMWVEPSAFFTGWPFSSTSMAKVASPILSPLRAMRLKLIGNF